jgi:hypothetical protein
MLTHKGIEPIKYIGHRNVSCTSTTNVGGGSRRATVRNDVASIAKDAKPNVPERPLEYALELQVLGDLLLKTVIMLSGSTEIFFNR